MLLREQLRARAALLLDARVSRLEREESCVRARVRRAHFGCLLGVVLVGTGRSSGLSWHAVMTVGYDTIKNREKRSVCDR